MKYVLDYQKYTALARATVAEGQVLLRNENDALPVKRGGRVAVFGRMQLHYYKSGTGSGGMVNVNKVTGILDALYEAQNEGKLSVYEKLVEAYRQWEVKNPIEEGVGWANEPWSQKEMPLSDETVKDASENAEYAIIVIARTAGEDIDNKYEPGAYLLSEEEKNMLKKVRAAFDKVTVVLNVGNVIDMSFVDEYKPDAVLYAWQGGMIGGLGTVDVITGTVNPSGRLSDTVAKKIEDYPSDKNFGDPKIATYEEDIFVGYRYFETFAKDKVVYPFGYGLSYTSFEITNEKPVPKDKSVLLKSVVKNTGNRSGKEVVQVYMKAPNGLLGKASRVLCAFEKTSELKPGESATVSFDIPFEAFASFDETGKCGLQTGWVLEKGTYEVYAGKNVRDAVLAGSFDLDNDILVEQLENAMGPVTAFKRMVSSKDDNSDTSVRIAYEDVPLRKDTQKQRRAARLPKDIPFTGDKGYVLKDVRDKKVQMDDFIAQFDKEELCTFIRGEGMSSKQVTPGTAAAFGGISPAIRQKGVPVGCMDDGPSGMRLDSGMKAFSLPNGTLMACTFNTSLVEELYKVLGVEMIKNRVDILLGPGMNIHRHPLNGRNFEYFSEDPYLTGAMGACQIRGLKSVGVTGSIKHFACNNQETGRQELDQRVSERALREIYLKGFEKAVKEAKADAVMTTYCQINGVWTSGCYDLNTTILRGQWGFKGIVMTDWWARISDEDTPCDKTNFAAMVRAQNDLYCCVPGAIEDVGDNALESLEKGTLTIGELQRTAKNVCSFLLDTPAFLRVAGEEPEVEIIGAEEGFEDEATDIEYIKIDGEGTIDLRNIEIKKGGNYYFGVELNDLGKYEVTMKGRGLPGNELAQLPAVLYVATLPILSLNMRGDGKEVSETIINDFLNKPNVMRIYFALGGVELESVTFKLIRKGLNVI
ncbi:MAG: glycoside hydrolase family 3 C-terminal domain-containing protein [Lachnospiraceae bacterium]|nr:glycoside hydrolase family 3 C-terminal domain-containing protein [Lachnospiraceae bacterium]